MKILSFIFSIVCTLPLWGQTFLERQLSFERVRNAKEKYNSAVIQLFKDSGFKNGPKYIYWRSFKLENELELWATDSADKPYKKIKTYKVCIGSGDLGPKRKFGDLQVPEGLYYIEKYNPGSNFLLSMKVSYPNESDVILADKENPGNEIYIHGACASIGCLPMTDSTIQEIYWITCLAQNYQGSTAKIPIDIFPCKFTEKNWGYLKKSYGNKKSLLDFWKNLEEGYKFFESNHIAPGFWVDQQGKYHIVYPQNYHINDPNH